MASLTRRHGKPHIGADRSVAFPFDWGSLEIVVWVADASRQGPCWMQRGGWHPVEDPL